MSLHIKTEYDDDIAKLVIMPGDPVRVKFIAENYLDDYKLVNNVRLNLAYTGYFKGVKVTVMASGMGCPSMAIYAKELFDYYNVEKIIRVGSCGSYYDEIDVKSVILAEKAYTLSNFSYQYDGKEIDLISASSFLDQKIIENAYKANIELRIGNIETTDVFYKTINNPEVKKNYCLGVEMETFALFYVASLYKKQASSILTVSDNLVNNKKLTTEERETTFNEAICLALNSIIE